MRYLKQFCLPILTIIPFSVAAIYKPDYIVLERINGLEIRQYPSLIVARTFVKGNFGEAGNMAFKRLAGYIFGGNSNDEKIAMTAPVTQTPDEIEPGAYWVSFFMPPEYDLSALPKPFDGKVEVTRVPEAKMAVITYKGGWGREKYNLNEERLITLIGGTSWRPLGEPVWARYNSPFMPSFMRSNEVMIAVKKVER